MTSGFFNSIEYTWVIFCHLSSFAGYVLPSAHLWLPWIIWKSKREEMPLVQVQGKEVLNFQISITCYAFLLYFVMKVVDFFAVPRGLFSLVFAVAGLAGLMMVLLILLHVICPIIASVQTKRGMHYRYPITFRLIK